MSKLNSTVRLAAVIAAAIVPAAAQAQTSPALPTAALAGVPAPVAAPPAPAATPDGKKKPVATSTTTVHLTLGGVDGESSDDHHKGD